jgi:hypothetical protein
MLRFFLVTLFIVTITLAVGAGIYYQENSVSVTQLKKFTIGLFPRIENLVLKLPKGISETISERLNSISPYCKSIRPIKSNSSEWHPFLPNGIIVFHPLDKGFLMPINNGESALVTCYDPQGNQFSIISHSNLSYKITRAPTIPLQFSSINGRMELNSSGDNLANLDRAWKNGSINAQLDFPWGILTLATDNQSRLLVVIKGDHTVVSITNGAINSKIVLKKNTKYTAEIQLGEKTSFNLADIEKKIPNSSTIFIKPGESKLILKDLTEEKIEFLAE